MKLRVFAGLLMLGAACCGGPLMAAQFVSGPSQAVSAPTQAVKGPAIWIDVPFAAQTKDGCGSAAIAMVMQYWEGKLGQPVAAAADPLTIQAALFSRTAGGIYASSMQKYLQEHGYQAFIFHGQWSDLQHHLGLGRPLIVMLKASGPLGPLHYVVVAGIDSARGDVFVNDPAQQKMLRISREGFESEWSYTRHWTLLAVPQTAH